MHPSCEQRFVDAPSVADVIKSFVIQHVLCAGREACAMPVQPGATRAHEHATGNVAAEGGNSADEDFGAMAAAHVAWTETV